MSRQPTFVDLFSGAGGLTLGLEDAGWECKLALDKWPEAIATYKRNIRGHPAESVDIHDVDHRYLAKRLSGEIDWVVGGPPCQGWSTVGKRQWDDDRNELVSEYFRMIRILQPRHFLIENVLGLKDAGGAGAIQEMATHLRDVGLRYRVSFHVLRAADYGVPQLRRRVVFVGSLDGLEWDAPAPTHDEAEWTTVQDALGDLPEVGPGQTATEYTRSPSTAYQRIMRGHSRELQGHTVSAHPPHLIEAISHIPDGGNRFAIPDHLQPKSGFHNSYSRLNSKLPAVAVTSNLGKPSATRCIHPFQDRGLTAREGARLQSFPDRFHFTGGIVSQRLQIANAVPPLLATALGRSLVDQELWSEPAQRLLATA